MRKKLYVLIGLLIIINLVIFIPQFNNHTESQNNNQITIDISHNTEIINTEFTRIGKLIVSEGRTTYKNAIADKNWYSDKSITYEINYKYGIGIDLTKLSIESIADNIVSVTMPVNEMKLN